MAPHRVMTNTAEFGSLIQSFSNPNLKFLTQGSTIHQRPYKKRTRAPGIGGGQRLLNGQFLLALDVAEKALDAKRETPQGTENRGAGQRMAASACRARGAVV